MQEKKGKGIEILGNIPSTLEDIKENPIFRPFSEFWKQSKMLERDERIENEELENAKIEINTILNTKIYDDSIIVSKFQRYIHAFEKYVLTMTKYNELADEKILDMKKIIEQYYLTRQQHIEEVNEKIESIENLKRELIELRKKLKEKDLEDEGIPKIKNKKKISVDEEETFEEMFNKKIALRESGG
jgi:hypothetical protein